MGDTTHPGIQQSLNEAERSFKQFSDLLKGSATPDIDQAKLFVLVGKLPSKGEHYQEQMNEVAIKAIRDVGNMTYLLGEALRNLTATVDQLGEAVRNLKSAVDKMPKRIPKPEPGLFDSRH